MIPRVNTEHSAVPPLPGDLPEEIARLKKDLNAVLLAHFYQESEIQDVADFIGDSLELSRRAAETEADVIVFAGVHFMAETAKILSPHKQVLLPDLEAGCSLAEGCPPADFRRFREAHPDHLALTYINCSAEVKALSDVICTSSSAERIISRIPADQPILFAPDRNLGRFLAKRTGREMLLWDGSCVVHETFSMRKLIGLLTEHPAAELIAHPECEEELLDKASFIGSTSALLNHVRNHSGAEFIVATESGIIHQMKKHSPRNQYYPLPPDSSCSCNECPYMKLNTMEKVWLCMKNKSPEITLPEEIIRKALIPIRRMFELSREPALENA